MTAIAHAQMALGNYEEALNAADALAGHQPQLRPDLLDAHRR